MSVGRQVFVKLSYLFRSDHLSQRWIRGLDRDFGRAHEGRRVDGDAGALRLRAGQDLASCRLGLPLEEVRRIADRDLDQHLPP